MSTKVLLRVLCTAVLLSVSAFAVDGVVLINQATVLAHGGFPYTITQSGSYKLTGNLTVPTGVDGIDINADSVTLDLNGFSIIGPVVGSTPSAGICCSGNAGYGVFSSHQDITVRNGSVSGMAGGIALQGEGGLVEEVHASRNGFGIVVATGIIRRCTADSNGGSGIETFFASVVSNSVANSNGDSGISAGQGTTVTGNTVFSNRQDGIAANHSTVLGNAARFNTGTGLSMFFGVFGSNSLTSNGLNLKNINSTAISQNNNACGDNTNESGC